MQVGILQIFQNYQGRSRDEDVVHSEARIARLAETLGYDSVWVTDSQMLFSDCYAVLALAARQTTRLRLGPGVAVCGTRIPPVQVAAMATLNRLAPGRVHLGIGTGNTAMRTMGQRPMPIAEYEEYLRVLHALLRGEIVDYTFAGKARPVT